MANINTTSGKHRTAQVAGAGFAGLTAAIALRQNGWDVTLHEKDSELRAFGAGIYLWHNGLRVLEGIDALNDVLHGTHTPPAYETWMQNKSVSKETFNGLPWRIMTRAHLHDALVKRAKEVGVNVRTNSEAVSAEADGRLTLQTGEVLEADLIVGADGVGSKVRDSLGFKQDRWVSTDGIIRLIVPRHKDKLGDEANWDNTIDSGGSRVYSPAAHRLGMVTFVFTYVFQIICGINLETKEEKEGALELVEDGTAV